MNATDIKSRENVLGFTNALMIRLGLFCLGDFQLVRDVRQLRRGTWNDPATPLGVMLGADKLGSWSAGIKTASPAHIFMKGASLVLALYSESYEAGTPFLTPCDDLYPHKGGVGYVPLHEDGKVANYAMLASISKFYPTWDQLFACLMLAYAMSKGPSISLDDAEGSMGTNVSMWLSANDDAFELLEQFLFSAFGGTLAKSKSQMDLRLLDQVVGTELYVVISRV